MLAVAGGCSGQRGIEVSGPLTQLSSTAACIGAPAPDDEDAEQCFNFSDDSVIRPRPVEVGEMVTVNAHQGELLQLRPVDAPG